MTDTQNPDEILKCGKRACDWEGTESERVKQRLDSIISVTVCPKCGCDTYRQTGKTKPQENSNAI